MVQPPLDPRLAAELAALRPDTVIGHAVFYPGGYGLYRDQTPATDYAGRAHGIRLPLVVAPWALAGLGEVLKEDGDFLPK
jgi:hypothetical protein